MNEIKVSVVLPVFNGEKYLAEAIESVLNQTHKNFELIIFDDGSTDDGLAIARSYQKSDSRIIVYTRENKGLVATLNEAISLVQSNFIVRMDADDICYPNRIELQLKEMINNDLDLIGGSIDLIENDVITGTLHYLEDSDDIRASILTWGRNFCHPAILAKKSLFEKHPYEDFPGIEDFALWIKLVFDTEIKMGNIAAPVLCYRLHEEQVTQIGKDKQWHLDNQLKIMQKIVCGSVQGITEENVQAFESLIRPKKRFIGRENRLLALEYIDKLFRSETVSRTAIQLLLAKVYLRLKRKNRPKNKRWILAQLMIRLKFLGGEHHLNTDQIKQKN